MDILRNNIEKKLLEDDLTVAELCDILCIDNDYDVLSCIAYLEACGKICLKSFKTAYQPDGCAIYIAKYGVI